MANEEIKEGVEEEVVEETIEETPEEHKEEAPEEKPQESLADRKARLERQLGQVNKKLGVEAPKTEKKSSKSDGLDYGQKAFLTTNGIKGAKEFEFVNAELKASGEDLDSLLENEYFVSRLEKFRALNKTSDAVPKGSRSGSVPTDTTEYWSNKPIEEVPAEMRQKVVNAKLAKANNKGVFYNS